MKIVIFQDLFIRPSNQIITTLKLNGNDKMSSYETELMLGSHVLVTYHVQLKNMIAESQNSCATRDLW